MPDSVAASKVRQQDAGLQELFPQDVLPQGRFPVLQQIAAARRVVARKGRARLQDV